MKHCNKCNRVYSDSALYCPECGSKLETPIERDIFGDPLYSHEEKSTQESTVFDEFGNPVQEKTEQPLKVSLKNRIAEILALISIGAFLVPLYGIAECVFAFIYNYREYRDKNKNIGYLILSVITTILAIIFTILIVRSGILLEEY